MIEATSMLRSVVTGASGSSAAERSTRAEVSGSETNSFAQMLNQVGTEAVQSLKAGEAAAISGLQGKATAQQVVDAVMTAERSLQTALAVRDKVVAAFQDITRMTI